MASPTTIRRASGWRSRNIGEQRAGSLAGSVGVYYIDLSFGRFERAKIGREVDSSCLEMTLKSCLDKMRSNSLSTRGCGESRQTESLGELERLVATVVR